MRTKVFVCCVVLAIAALLGGCASKGSKTAPNEVTLILGAYTVPKEAYENEVIPKFQEYWKTKTGQTVKFTESYVGSGEQARAIIAGFEADVAALSLARDIQKIVDAGFITHDWTAAADSGMITDSVAVIGVRKGNPKGIKDWTDLAKSDIDVLTPNPDTSGGAMWNVLAVYGAGLDYNDNDPARAKQLLLDVRKRVKVLDKSARASTTTFENGVGDAIITYENEMLLRQKQGKDYEFVIPRSTILIENPIAVVDKNVDKHGVREVAEAFVEFCHTAEAQRGFGKYGLRPVDQKILAEFSDKYPVPEMLFTVEKFGGWGKIDTEIFGENGVWADVTKRAVEGR